MSTKILFEILFEDISKNLLISKLDRWKIEAENNSLIICLHNIHIF